MSSGTDVELPSGEVTFVFTDIEGSTRLLRKLGDDYAGLRDRHRELLRTAAAAEGGVEVDAEGDALFLVFTNAAAALRAGLAGQRALATEPWPDGAQVRVRIGMHADVATPVAGGYVSLAVHQAARIAAAAHGGQIVFSDATLAAADDVTFAVLRDLGPHYLKDFDDPVRLWQLSAPGVAAEFPDLRTGDVRLPFTDPAGTGIAGIPTQWTSFVGREREVGAAAKALGEARLVSLIGAGGVGKTRLAVEVAQAAGGQYGHGGAFIELVAVRADFLVQAVAAALGVTGRAGQTLDESVLEYLAGRSALLVLDNCEHLLEDVAALVSRILARCPHIAVLLTSRERLGVPGERVLPVLPLEIEAGADDPVPAEAVRLFLDRATAADAGFSDDPAVIAQLCARLDGMPLAIELAAARVATIGAAALLAGLDDRLRLLAGGRSADERHRSLRSVLDWSHSLLDDEERRFLRRLGVFVGGFDLNAAAEIAADGNPAASADLLGRLVDKSLIARQRGAAGRWRLLETVRTYALDKLLTSEDESAARARHLSWAARTAAGLEQRLGSGSDWRVDFDDIGDDLRAAIVAGGDRKTGYELAMSTGHLVFAHRFHEEAIAHFEQAFELALDPGAAARAMRMAADSCLATVDTAGAYVKLLRAAELAAEAGDAATQAICLTQAVVFANRFPGGLPEDVPSAQLNTLLDEARRVAPAAQPLVQAHVAQAAAWNAHDEKLYVNPALADQALAAARDCGDPILIAGALDAVSSYLVAHGRMREAAALAEERMAARAQLPRHEPRAIIELIDIMHMANEQALAAGELRTALRDMRSIQDDDAMTVVRFNALSKLMVSLTLTGRVVEACAVADEMWAGYDAVGRPATKWMAPAVLAAALAHGLRGDASNAAEWLHRTQGVIGEEDMYRHRNSAGMATFVSARLAMHEGRLDEGLQLASTGQVGNRSGWYEDDRHWFYDAYVWALDAELAVLNAAPDAAVRLERATPVGQENRWAAACLDRAQWRLTGETELLHRSVAGWEAIDARFERACTLLLLPDRADEGRAELSAMGASLPR